MIILERIRNLSELIIPFNFIKNSLSFVIDASLMILVFVAKCFSI